MYDSWYEGIDLQSKLYEFLKGLELNNFFNFIHIIITDGKDDFSIKKSLADLSMNI